MAVDHFLTYHGRALKDAPHRARLRTIERTIDALAVPPGLVYLDFGCSNGFLTARVRDRVRPARTIGLDRPDEQVRQGRLRHSQIDFRRFDLCSWLQRRGIAHRAFNRGTTRFYLLSPDGTDLPVVAAVRP